MRTLKGSLQAHRRRLSRHEFSNEEFSNLDLRGAIGMASVWKRCSFLRVRFEQANLSDATFEQCHFTECTFGQTVLVSRIHDSDFTRCNFDQAGIVAAEIVGSFFTRCSFVQTNFSRATLTDVIFKDSNFHGANMDFAETRDLDLRGSNLWAALTPLNCAFFEGTKFDDNQVLRFMALVDHSAADRVWAPLDEDAYLRQWKVVHRAIGNESDVAEDRRGEPEVGLEVEEVGDGGSASGAPIGSSPDRIFDPPPWGGC